jgi:hypothetical protein
LIAGAGLPPGVEPRVKIGAVVNDRARSGLDELRSIAGDAHFFEGRNSKPEIFGCGGSSQSSGE